MLRRLLERINWWRTDHAGCDCKTCDEVRANMIHYCGCCGADIGEREVWCKRCSKHVLHDVPFELATYWAQHKKRCPFED